ncbi:MAG: transglutaminase-like domain-containing protein [Planctomycetota bacterium]
MNPSLASSTVPADEVVRAAAVLLQDPNPRVHKVCEERLLSWDAASLPALVAIAECEDPVARRRVQRLLQRIHRRVWKREFQAFVERRDFDLEEGLLLLARLPRPLLDVDRVVERFASWAGSLAPRLEHAGTRKAATVLSELFFWELGFKGDSRNYYDPANCFLDQVVERRRGIPITLSAVYLLVGRRVGLPLEGVGLPGHFILRLRGARSILLDPFHGGRTLTRKDCVERLQAMGYGFKESYLDPVSDFQMLSRVLGNLLHTYRFSEDQELVEALRSAHQVLLSTWQDRA